MNIDKLIGDALSEASILIDDNKEILTEIKKKFDETEKLIFDKTCLKREHLDRCEVTFCCYFRDRTCKYPKAHGQMKSMLEKYSF